MTATPDPRAGPTPSGDSLEPALARVLQLGTYVSIGFMGLGVLTLLLGGTSPLAGGPPLLLDRIASDIAGGRPAGFLWLGILGIVATPLLRVTGALLGFWRRGERAMALVALLVLGVVAAGVITGLLSG